MIPITYNTGTIANLLLIPMIFLLFSEFANGQERIPREYVHPDEMIAFDRQTTIPEALEVIAQFAEEFENRLLIDRSGRTDAIGMRLPLMHWKDALQYILRIHDLALHEEPDFYEILTRQQLAQREEGDRDPGVADRRAETVRQRFATTRTREVRINATFFEGSRRALREVGVDWSTLTSDVPGNLRNFVTEQGSERIPAPFENRFVSVNASGAQSVSQNVFNSLINFGEIGAGIEVQALFSAFEADNLGKVLATPSIKVMDGELGRIQVGEDFSIKQRDFAGNVTDQFFSTGTILTVTPHIIEYQDTTFIYVELHAERSSAQPDPVSTIISKEEADTHALLLDGESTVIAGLYRTDRSEVRRGIPILKDLPSWFFGLRYLFGYNSTDASETELIVLIQAELEESIPNRLARQLRTQRELLELQQQRHREGLDFVPPVAQQPLEPEQRIFEELRPPEQNRAEEHEAARQPERPVDTRPAPGPPPMPRPIAEEPDREALPERVEPAERVERVVEPHSFYTIAGSFRNRANAEQLYNRLVSEGYDAHILQTDRSNLYYVAYAGFREREEAIRFTNRIQREVQREAWLAASEWHGLHP